MPEPGLPAKLRALLAVRGRYWWRGRLWCPGCYGKHWLWRTVKRCG